MKVKILATPKAIQRPQQDINPFTNPYTEETPKMEYGGQKPGANSTGILGNNRYLSTQWSWMNQANKKNMPSQPFSRLGHILPEASPEDATINAEKQEKVMGDFTGDGMPTLMNVGGKPHTEGGKDIIVPPNSFVFSDTPSLKLRDPQVLAEFGGGTKPQTPAMLATKYDLQKYKAIIDDKRSEEIDRNTAKLNYANAVKKLNSLAGYQEALKESKGIPTSTLPGQPQDQGQDDSTMMSKFGGRTLMQTGGNGNKLESGVVVDKNTNMAKIYQNFNPVDSFPVITGRNPSNDPNLKRGADEGEYNTPAGQFMMNPVDDVYGYKGFALDNPDLATGIYAHQTYPPEYNKRNPLYSSNNPTDRDYSHGCINCRKGDLDKLYKYFPNGDTLNVLPATFNKEQLPQLIEKHQELQKHIATQVNKHLNKETSQPSVTVNPWGTNNNTPQGPPSDVIDFTNAPGWQKRNGGKMMQAGGKNNGWYNRENVTSDAPPISNTPWEVANRQNVQPTEDIYSMGNITKNVYPLNEFSFTYPRRGASSIDVNTDNSQITGNKIWEPDYSNAPKMPIAQNVPPKQHWYDKRYAGDPNFTGKLSNVLNQLPYPKTAVQRQVATPFYQQFVPGSNRAEVQELQGQATALGANEGSNPIGRANTQGRQGVAANAINKSFANLYDRDLGEAERIGAANAAMAKSTSQEQQNYNKEYTSDVNNAGKDAWAKMADFNKNRTNLQNADDIRKRNFAWMNMTNPYYQLGPDGMPLNQTEAQRKAVERMLSEKRGEGDPGFAQEAANVHAQIKAANPGMSDADIMKLTQDELHARRISRTTGPYGMLKTQRTSEYEPESKYGGQTMEFGGKTLKKPKNAKMRMKVIATPY